MGIRKKKLTDDDRAKKVKKAIKPFLVWIGALQQWRVTVSFADELENVNRANGVAVVHTSYPYRHVDIQFVRSFVDGAGSLYAASTSEQTDVDASAGVGDTMDLVAQTGGSTGNSVTTTETLTNGSFGDVTLTGGANSHLAGKAARDNLDSDGRKDRKYIKSEPVPASGDFTALKMHRTAGGLLEVEYDGVAV